LVPAPEMSTTSRAGNAELLAEAESFTNCGEAGQTLARPHGSTRVR
jgi:hypothetical protein